MIYTTLRPLSPGLGERRDCLVPGSREMGLRLGAGVGSQASSLGEWRCRENTQHHSSVPQTKLVRECHPMCSFSRWRKLRPQKAVDPKRGAWPEDRVWGPL